MTMKDTPTPTPPAGYADWLASLKTRIHHAIRKLRDDPIAKKHFAP